MKHNLQMELEAAVKSAKLRKPWNLLPKQIPYKESLYSYALRIAFQGTVRLFDPILFAAATMYSEDIAVAPYRLVERRTIRGVEYIMEAGMPDGTSLLVVSRRDRLRISVVEQDKTHSSCLAFKDMNSDTLALIMLALMPVILEIDTEKGNEKIAEALAVFAAALSGYSTWNTADDIPDIFKENAYFLDAVNTVINEEIELDCGPLNATTPEEVDSGYFANPSTMLSGTLITEKLLNDWTPIFVKATAVKHTASNTMTIAEAKKVYSKYSAHRNWTVEEKKLIPCFPDNMPVMPETLRMLRRYTNTLNDTNPACNFMWRGDTGFGKSTGSRQLACILNRPYLPQTCHTGMEAQDLQSVILPDTTPKAESDVDVAQVVTASFAAPEATADYIVYRYYCEMDDAAKAQFDDLGEFTTKIVMEPEDAELDLFGTSLGIQDPCALIPLYSAAYKAVTNHNHEQQMEGLRRELGGEQNSGNKFVHVMAPYMKAMTKGYVVEMQEVSRIRDSGVLVSINEFDRPGAKMQLINGETVERHKDAIWLVTDNVGYDSCRPVDPSVLRRMSLIIDSYEYTKEGLIARVMANTGVTDTELLDYAYELWNTVREYCAHHSITDGSCSPVEFERFVQATRDDGLDFLEVNLKDCIISKSTSSVEDQGDIWAACRDTVISKH